jgi:hypothetical protein
MQGETLEIVFEIDDIEGDEMYSSVNTSTMVFDEIGRRITLQTTNDDVGTIRFGLSLWDEGSINDKRVINFEIRVENKNDPPGDPRITSPTDGLDFDINESFSLIATCDDPDIPLGQVLTFSWSSNISGHLGIGKSLVVQMAEDGDHLITLTISDGEFERTASINIIINPDDVIDDDPPDKPKPGDDKGIPIWMLGALAIIVIIGTVLFLVSSKRRAEHKEAEDEAEFVEGEKRDGLQRTAKAIKEVADKYEKDLEASRAEEEVPKEIEIEGSVHLPSTGLTIEAARTESDSEEVEELFEGISEVEETSTEDREELRLVNLKRNYQNAIGRLPYGIPAAALKDRDWVNLASDLATGEKDTLPDGKEITSIKGHWYYSDADDSSTFLKEHDAKPVEEEEKEPPVGDVADSALLRKLEERFILGEISEKAYNELKKKYGGK